MSSGQFHQTVQLDIDVDPAGMDALEVAQVDVEAVLAEARRVAVEAFATAAAAVLEQPGASLGAVMTTKGAASFSTPWPTE